MTNPFTTPFSAFTAPLPASPSWPAAAAPISTIQPPAGTAVNGVTGEYIQIAGQFVTQDELLMRWQKSKDALETAKNDEMLLRKLVVAVYTNPDKNKGTERVELGNGWELKTVKKISYKLVSKVEGVSTVDAVSAACVSLGSLSPEASVIAQRLVKWSADLSVSEYGKLTPEMKAIIDEVLVTDEGAPTVELIEPKEVAA